MWIVCFSHRIQCTEKSNHNDWTRSEIKWRKKNIGTHTQIQINRMKTVGASKLNLGKNQQFNVPTVAKLNESQFHSFGRFNWSDSDWQMSDAEEEFGCTQLNLLLEEKKTLQLHCISEHLHFRFNSISGTGDSVEKLEKHLSLLKEEYTKLQRNYAELERKYSKAAAASGDKELGEFSSFVSRLAITVASLYGRKTYSDLTIRLSDKSIPAHKFVLNARSEEWREEVLADINELGEFWYLYFVHLCVWGKMHQLIHIHLDRLEWPWNGYWIRTITMDLYGCHRSTAWYAGPGTIESITSLSIAWTVGFVRTRTRLIGRCSILCTILLCRRRGRRIQFARILFRIDFNALGRFDAARFRAHVRTITV